MKSEWIETTVGEIADAIQYGYTESSTIQNIGPKFLRITDIQNGKVDWQTVPYCQCDELDKYKLRKGDILFARTGATTGKSFLVKDCPETVFASYLIRVRLKREILPNYVYQFFQTPVYWNQIKQFTTGSTQGGFNASKLAEIKIPLPPLPIQQQIAAILEKADAAREKRRQANQLTEQFLQSAFLEMFGDPATNPKGWEKIEAQEIFKIQLGKMLSAKNYTGKNLRPYLRNLNVQWGRVDLSDVKLMDFDDQEFQKYKLRKGDILVCEGGEVGRTAIWNGQIENCCYQNALHRLRIIKPIIESAYFLYFMFFAAQHGLILQRTSQVTIAHFTAEKFKEFKVLVPPLSEQQKFAALAEKVESLRARQRQSEQELEHLFHSLMQRAFRGELVCE